MACRGITQVTFNVHQIIQKFIALPTIFDKKTGRSCVNPKFLKNTEGVTKKERLKLIPFTWRFGNGAVLWFFIYCSVHNIELVTNFKADKSFKILEKCIIYGFGIAMTGQSLVTWYTYGRDPYFCSLLANQLPRACGIKYEGWPSKKRHADIHETLGYGMAVGIFSFPFIVSMFPFLRSYDPVSKIISPFLSKWPRRIVSSLITGSTTMFGALICCYALLQVVLGALCLTKIAKDNLERSSGEDIDTVVVTSATPRSTFSEEQNNLFSQSLHLHNQLRIFAQICNEAMTAFIPTLQLIGISFCVISNIGLVRLGDKLEVVFILFGTILTVGFTVFNLLMLSFASHLNVLTNEMIHRWKCVELGKCERKEVKAMKVASLGMGKFFPIRKATGMDVLDSILDYTMTGVTL